MAAALHPKLRAIYARLLQGDHRSGSVFRDVAAHFGLWSVYVDGVVGETGKAGKYPEKYAPASLDSDSSVPVEAFGNFRSGRLRLPRSGIATEMSLVDENA